MRHFAILIIGFCALNCSNLKDSRYKCFKNEQAKAIIKGIEFFDQFILQNYCSDTVELASGYKKFLKEVSELKFDNKNYILDTNQRNKIIESFFRSGLISEFMIEDKSENYEEVIIPNDPKDNDEVKYTLNLNGAYVKCLTEHCENNPFLIDYLDAIKSAGLLSSNLIAGGLLYSWDNDHFDNDYVKLVILIELFYLI